MEEKYKQTLLKTLKNAFRTRQKPADIKDGSESSNKSAYLDSLQIFIQTKISSILLNYNLRCYKLH